MKFAKLATLAVTLAAVPLAASAQEVGTVIYGNDGEPVGTVTKKTDTVAYVDTGTHTAPLPIASMVQQDDKWVVGATKASVDTMMAERKAKTEAALTAALVPGTAVVSADKQPVGSVLAVNAEADQVILERGTGVISLKRKHFRVRGGTLTARYKMAQLEGVTKEIPEGVEVPIAGGTLIRTAEGFQMTPAAEATASAAAPATAGASE